MVGSSTNALEHAKKMEILKSAGVVFNESKKSQGKTSFADKLIVETYPDGCEAPPEGSTPVMLVMDEVK